MPKSAPERLTVSIATREIGVPERCVHIGDRASDIYEFFCLAQALGANFLVRGCVDHLAEAGGTTIAPSDAGHPAQRHAPDPALGCLGLGPAGAPRGEFATMVVRPPIGKQQLYTHQIFRIVHADGADPPADRRPCSGSRSPPSRPRSCRCGLQARRACRRWSIETFFKSLSPARRSALAPPRSVRSASKIASMRFTASNVVVRSTAPERGRRHPGIRSSRSTRLNGGLVA